MQVEQKKWTKVSGWQDFSPDKLSREPQLVLVFGGKELLKDKKNYQSLKALYPNANILSCSTAGEIIGTEVLDDSMVVTAIHFDRTELKFAESDIAEGDDSNDSGRRLAETLNDDGLVHVMVFSDGLLVNGTDLVNGLKAGLPESVSVTGGLVGDGANFKETVVGLNNAATSGKVALVNTNTPLSGSCPFDSSVVDFVRCMK